MCKKCTFQIPINPLIFFNLDVVLAVGYRANSTEASRFRRWATNVLKQYLVSGYAINEKRLAEKQEQIEVLKNSLNLLTRSITSQAKNLEVLVVYITYPLLFLQKIRCLHNASTHVNNS